MSSKGRAASEDAATAEGDGELKDVAVGVTEGDGGLGTGVAQAAIATTAPSDRLLNVQELKRERP